MLSDHDQKQKSPKRRFLFIIGVTAFIGFLVLGGMIAFWDKFPLQLPKTQRTIFGSVIIVYAILRFSRYLRKDPDER